MKKCGIVYLISLYLFQGVFMYLSMSNSEYVFQITLLLGLLCMITSIVTIVCVCKNLKRIRNDYKLQRSLNRMMLTMKLVTIPFYLINFAFWVLIAMAFMVVPGVIIFIPIVFLGVIIACLVLITTSAYSFSNICIQNRNGIFPMKKCILHSILQVLFVLDVFDSFYLYYNQHRFLKQLLLKNNESSIEDRGIHRVS